MCDQVFRRLFERQAGVDSLFRLRHFALQPFDPSRTIHRQFDARVGILVADQLGQPGLIDLLTGFQSILVVLFSFGRAGSCQPPIRAGQRLLPAHRDGR